LVGAERPVVQSGQLGVVDREPDLELDRHWGSEHAEGG